MRFSVLLLGPFEVHLDGVLVTGFESVKARALLAYLAAEAGKPHTRTELAGLLWPDWPDEAAHKNLRHSLYSLRKTLQISSTETGILYSDRNAIWLEPGEACFIDALEFSTCLTAAKADLTRSEVLDRLEKASAWLRGPFLDSFLLKDSPDFETWLVSRRQHQDQEALQAWTILADWYDQLGDFARSEAYIRRQINLEPWHESAHRHLMRNLVQQGKRAEALAQYAACRSILQAELNIEPSAETVQLAEQIRNQTSPDLSLSEPRSTTQAAERGSSALPGQRQPMHNLRESISRFIGRDEDAARIKIHLSRRRLVNLVGPGGVGKTRLALAVAGELVSEFEHGVWLVELAALNEPGLVTQVVASTFQLRKSQNQSLNATLLDYLRDRHLLLVLDNCEHLVDASARLAERILSQCPQVTILATSRERLNIDGEMVYHVPPLRTPGALDSMELAQLARFDSVQLFLDRGQLASPGFSLSADNASTIAQICLRLDGIPLALELAAARLQVLNVHQLAQRLDDRFRLLTGGRRGVFAHQQTLLASIDWSHDLLNEDEQRLFRRLSVFAGGWTLEAAEVVCTGNGLEQLAVLDHLAQLTSKSLVDVTVNEDGTQRYRMLETIRQYAHQKLSAAGEHPALHQAHLEYYLALSEGYEDRLLSWDSIKINDLLDNEIENFRQAMQFGYDDPEPAGPIKGLRLAAALGWYWDIHGRASEGYRWLITGIARLPSDNPDLFRILARAYYHAGNSLFFLDETIDMTGARSILQKSIDYAIQAGDPIVQSLAQVRLAGYVMNKYIWPSIRAVESAEYREAQILVDHSLSLSESSGDKSGLAYALYMKGSLIHYSGDFESARQVLEESLLLANEIGDILTIDAVLLSLGGVLLMQGDFAGSTAYYVKGLEQARKISNKHSVIMFLSGLMSSNLLEGNYQAMEALGLEGLELSSEFGDRRMAVFFWRMMGISALHLGQVKQAAGLFELSRAAALQLDDEYGLLVYLALMPGIAIGLGLPDKAARLLGAVDTTQQTYFKPFDEHDQMEILQFTVKSQSMMKESDWDAAYQAGRRLTVDQGMQEARELALLLGVSE